MANTCIPGDISGLRVSVNGAQKGMLDPSPGASGTFAGTSGSNSVTVVAKFGNGAESVVYQGVLKIFSFLNSCYSGWINFGLVLWITIDLAKTMEPAVES
jgi:hypothetical protein